MNNETTRSTPTGQSRTLAQRLASVLRNAADALAAGTAKRPTIAAIKNDLAYDVEVELLQAEAASERARHTVSMLRERLERLRHDDDCHADKRVTSHVYDATKEIGRKTL